MKFLKSSFSLHQQLYAIHAIQSVEANYKTAAVGAWRGQVTVNRVCVKVLQVTDDTLAAYRYKFDVNTQCV